MNDQLLPACRAVVTIVFAASALGKGRSPARFAAALRAMRVVPGRLAGPLSVAVPVAEAAVAVAVWVPAPAAWAFVLASAMLAVFTAALVSVLRRGIAAPCSCFGVSTAPVGPAQVVRNCVLLAFCAVGSWAAFTTSRPTVVPDYGGMAVGLLVAVPSSILLIFSEIVADVFAKPSVEHSGRH
ncbi:MauE/DoxX family redox-associated membrane protein [Kitasatospora sp. NPDC057198]|uniref:MauE/DoxX family redox-associated membrane protein n=1 Tax=Kitasatospora sp. NPDC057198 TaxID=3346046 RepID=UPI003642C4F2